MPTPRPTVVVCAGDSITHGFMSANYVRQLAVRLEQHHMRVVNAGVNGDLAYNLLTRLDEIIACRPDVVTVLSGTNDCASGIGPSWENGYVKQQRLPQAPSLAWYRSTLGHVVTRLQEQTSARLALLEIPMLGEDLHSSENERVGQYNEAVHMVADAAEVPVLPLHARLRASLPEGHQAPVFDGTKRLMGRALGRHLFLRQSYDAISAGYGLALLTDHVHLNDRAATVVADLVEEFVLGGTAG